MFDLTSAESLASVSRWMTEVSRYSNNQFEKILIGNKSDLPAKVSDVEANETASSLGMRYFKTSAKTGDNVDESFEFVIGLTRSKLIASETADTGTISLESLVSKPPSDRKCC